MADNTKLLIDLCSKRVRLFHDFMLSRITFNEYSSKMANSLNTTNSEYELYKVLQAEPRKT